MTILDFLCSLIDGPLMTQTPITTTDGYSIRFDGDCVVIAYGGKETAPIPLPAWHHKLTPLL
ncbi:MAG TPA: hypothetical protein PKD55_10725 [Bellilinea sp.]|nr:hypothetical protein [Bellilinea sp.]